VCGKSTTRAIGRLVVFLGLVPPAQSGATRRAGDARRKGQNQKSELGLTNRTQQRKGIFRQNRQV
jgi:hypothetical protein